MSDRERFYFGYSFNQNFSHNEFKESNLLPSVVPHNNYNNFGYGNCNEAQERRHVGNSFRNFDKELDDGQQMEHYQGENNFNDRQMQQQICDRGPQFHPNPNEMFNRDHRPWHNNHHEPYGWKSRPYKRRPSHLLDIWRPNYDDAEQPQRDRYNFKKFCAPNNPRNNYYYNKPIKFVDRFVPINKEKLSTKNKTTTSSDVKSTDSCSPATSTSTITKSNEDESKIVENTETVNIDLPGSDDLIVIDVSGGSNDNSLEEIQTAIAENNIATSSTANETSVNPITCYSDISQDSVTNFPLNNEKTVAQVTSDTVTETETISLPQKPIDETETAIDIEKALAMINVDDIDTSKSYLEYCPFVDNHRMVDMDLGSPVYTTTQKTTHYLTKEALIRQLDEAIGDENEDYEEKSKNKSSCFKRRLSTDTKDIKPVDRRSPPSEDRSRSDITKRRSSQADRSVDSKKRRISIDNSNTKTAKIYSRRKSLVEVCQDRSSLSHESTDRSARRPSINEDSASKVSKRRTSFFEESSPNSKSPKQEETKKSVYFPNLARDYKIPKKKTSFSSPDRPFNSTISTLFGEDSGYATDKTTTNKDKPFNKSSKNISDHLKTKQPDPRLNCTKEKYVNKKVPQKNIAKEKISEDKVKKKIKDFVKSNDNKTTSPKGTEKRSNNKSAKENVKDNERKLVSRKEIKETTSKSSSKSVVKEIKETNLKSLSTSVAKEFKETNLKSPCTSVTKEFKETNLKSPSTSVTKEIKETNLKSLSTSVTKEIKETNLKSLSTSVTKEFKETNLKSPSTSVTKEIKETNLKSLSTSVTKEIKETNLKSLSTSVTKEIKETNLKSPSTSVTKEIKETNLKSLSTSVAKEVKETNLKSPSTSVTKEFKETNLKSPSTSVSKEIKDTNLKSPSKSVIKEITRQNDIHKSPRRSEDYKPQKISNKRRKTSSQSEENKNSLDETPQKNGSVQKSNKHSKKEDIFYLLSDKNSRKSESLRSKNKSLKVANERDISKKSCTEIMQNHRFKIKDLTIFLRREVLENKPSLAATIPEDVVTSEQKNVTETPNPDKSNYLVNSQSSEPNSEIPIDAVVRGTINLEDDNQVNTSENITNPFTSGILDFINKYFPVRHLDSFVASAEENLTETSKTTDSASTDNAEPQITNVITPKVKEEPPPKLIQIHTALKSENSDFERSQPLILEPYPPFQKTRIISVENECIEEAVIMGTVDLHDDTQIVKQQNILRQKNDSQEVVVINEKEEEIIDLTDDPVERDDKEELHKLLEIANIDKTEKITLYRSAETEQEDEEVQAMSVCILPSNTSRSDTTNIESKQSKMENQFNSCKFAEQSSSSNNSDLTPIVRTSTAVPIAEVNPPNKKQHFLSINKNLFQTRDETRQISNTGGNTSVADVSAVQTPSSVSAISEAQPVHIPLTSDTSVDALNSSVAGNFNKTSTQRTQTVTNDRRNCVGRILEDFISGQGSQSVRSTLSSTSDSSTNQQVVNTAAPSNNVAQSTNENLNTWQEYMADFVFLTIQKHINSKLYLTGLKTTKVDQLSLNIETLISNASTDFSRKIHGENMVRLLKRLNIHASVETHPEKTIGEIYNHLRLKGIDSLPQFYICLDSIMSNNKEFYINHPYLRNFYKLVNSCADQIRLKATTELQSTQPKFVLTNQQLTTLNDQINFCNMITKSYQNQNRQSNIQSTPKRNSLPIQQAYPIRNIRMPTTMPHNIPQMRPFTQNLPNASPIQQRSSNIYNQQQQVINRKIPQRVSIEQSQQHHPPTSQSILQYPVNISNVCNTPNNQQRFPPCSQNRDISQSYSSNTTFKIPSNNTSMLRQVRKIPASSDFRIQVPTYAVSPAYSTPAPSSSDFRIQVPTYAVSPAYSTPAPSSRETSTLAYTPSHPMPPSMTHIRNHIYAPMPFTPTYLNEQTVSPPTTESSINESLSDRSFISESTVNHLPINRNPVNKSSTNESTISSSLINQSPVNKSLNKTPIINSSPINQNPVNKSHINETTGNHSPIDESTISSSLINQSPVNKSLNKAPVINSSPIDQSPVNKSPNKESTNNSSPIDQSSAPNKESTINSSVTIHQSDVNESHINESSDASNSRSDDLDTTEGIIIDLTWLNDMDSEDLKQELDFIKKEEIEEDEVILNEEQFPLADIAGPSRSLWDPPSPFDPGLG